MRDSSPYQAVIFDMDGLMFDTERLARLGWEGAFAENGYTLTNEFYQTLIGKAIPTVRQMMEEEYGSDMPFEAVYARRQQIYENRLAQEGVPLKPGLVGLLQFLHTRRVPLAVGSSTPRNFGKQKLAASGLGGYFKAFAFGDDVANGKPAPDIFLLAAKRLGMRIERCIVLEDSPSGVHAAHAAGALALMVPDSIAPAPDTAVLAYRVLPSLDAAQPVIARLLNLPLDSPVGGFEPGGDRLG